MTDAETISKLRAEMEASKAETAACVEFLRTELDWSYFRAEMLYSPKDDAEKHRMSEENARQLSNFLKASGHGIAFLKQADQLRRDLDVARAANQSMIDAAAAKTQAIAKLSSDLEAAKAEIKRLSECDSWGWRNRAERLERVLRELVRAWDGNHGSSVAAQRLESALHDADAALSDAPDEAPKEKP